MNQHNKKLYRHALSLLLFGVFIITWANLAVGIIGSENNPTNILFFLVPLIGFIIAALNRFRSRGMALVAITMAVFQFLIPFLALVINRPEIHGLDAVKGLVLIIAFNSCFASLFLASFYLFKKSLK